MNLFSSRPNYINICCIINTVNQYRAPLVSDTHFLSLLLKVRAGNELDRVCSCKQETVLTEISHFI